MSSGDRNSSKIEVRFIGRTVHVTMGTRIDEETMFVEVLDRLDSIDTVEVDFGRVQNISSVGVRGWLYFKQKISDRHVVLTNVSPSIVRSASTINNFADGFELRSMQLPYFCDNCELEHEELVSVVNGQEPSTEPISCPKCGSLMEFDDFPNYFAFLK